MTTRIGTDVNEAARLLKAGEVVAIPTETVYGLAANAFDPDAVLKVFEVKQRPSFDPLIVHVRDRDQLGSVVKAIPADAGRLIAEHWPGPLTLVLPKHENVPDVVTSGLDTVGVRMPAHPKALQLLRTLDFPLAAPSANPFGYVSPTTAQHVMDQLGGLIPYILDGGPCSVGVESTIVGWESGKAVLYRSGGVAIEQLGTTFAKRGLSPLSIQSGAERGEGLGVRGISPLSSGEGLGVRAPGMLASHYAPAKLLIVGDVPKLIRERSGKRIGAISFSIDHRVAYNEVLSPSRDLHEAARNLFAAMRRLDKSDVDLILAEVFPEEGLGRAINDRLQRACLLPGQASASH